MPTKKCRIGFSCAVMMMTPGLTADDCPNQETCGTYSEYTPDEEIEFQMFRDQQRETIRVTHRQAAAMMLIQRGNPQTIETLGIAESINNIDFQLGELRSHLAQFDNQYIAPPGCEAHRYNVKRGYATYWYNKLTADSTIFEPSVKRVQVRVIHLSHDDDPRNLEAREGIQRRNKLLALRTHLRQIEQSLMNVLADINN